MNAVGGVESEQRVVIGRRGQVAAVLEVQEPLELVGVVFDVPPGVRHRRQGILEVEPVGHRDLDRLVDGQAHGLQLDPEDADLGLGHEDLGEPGPEFLVRQVADGLDQLRDGPAAGLGKEGRELVLISASDCSASPRTSSIFLARAAFRS